MYTDVLAIDAIFFQYPEKQFEESKVMREIVKCYSGFNIYGKSQTPTKAPAISSGKDKITYSILKGVFFFVYNLVIF